MNFGDVRLTFLLYQTGNGRANAKGRAPRLSRSRNNGPSQHQSNQNNHQHSQDMTQNFSQGFFYFNFECTFRFLILPIYLFFVW